MWLERKRTQGTHTFLALTHAPMSPRLPLQIPMERKKLRVSRRWGAWVAQPVKPPTLGFVSGLDLKVMRSSPASGSVLGGVPT